MKYMIENLDPELWQLFKVFCAMEKISMRKKIEELIRDEVERGKRRYGKRKE